METAQRQHGMMPAIQLSLPVVDFNDLIPTMESHVVSRMVTSLTNFSGGLSMITLFCSSTSMLTPIQVRFVPLSALPYDSWSPKACAVYSVQDHGQYGLFLMRSPLHHHQGVVHVTLHGFDLELPASSPGTSALRPLRDGPNGAPLKPKLMALNKTNSSSSNPGARQF